MNPGVEARRTAERLTGITRQQTVLRLGTGLVPVGVLVLAAATGGSLALPLVVIVLVVTLWTMVLPHGWAPLVLVSVLATVWASQVPTLLDVRTVLAAALLFMVHILCTLTSYGPPEMTLSRDLLLVWLRRTMMVVLVAAGVWLAAVLLRGAGPPEDPWVSVAALALLLGWTAFLTVRLLGRDAAPGSRAGVS